MPVYEYKCTLCRYEFSQFQGIKEPPLKMCPKCGGLVERLISGGVGLIFKGTGFYQTDYKNKKPSTESQPKSKEKPSSEKPPANC